MKTYLRILSYAGSIRQLTPLYLLATVLATVLGLVNLTLLIPLLKVLFNQADVSEILGSISKPTLTLSLSYLKDLFNYHFAYVIITQGRLSALYLVCGTIVIATLLANVFRYLARAIIAVLCTNVVSRLRSMLFDKILRLPVRYFTDQNRGDFIARVMSDVQEVEHAVDHVYKTLFKDPITIIGFAVVLFQISPRLTLVAIIALPIVGGFVGEFIRRLLKKALRGQILLSGLTSVVEETLRGIRSIFTFDAQPYAHNKFEQENLHYAQVSRAILLRKGFIPVLSECLGITMLAILMAYGGRLILLQEATFTSSTFITYVIIFFQTLIPIRSISKSLGEIQRGLAAGKRIFTLIDMKATEEQVGVRQLENLKESIVFQDVSFAYDQVPTLQRLSITIPQGKKVAIVGPSGSGKSTIIGLLSGIYQPTAGTITIDGIPTQDYAPKSLRRLISVVTHETVLFHDTVYNNITLGRPEGTSAEAVKAAARVADAHDFITALPKGYETIVGAKYSQLSAGQMQRIGIARAVLQQPSILILDEATTALDSVVEKRVQGSLNNFMQGKTLLIISHNLRSVRDADEIWVLDAGEVVAHGTHEGLLQQDGLYKRLTTAH
ncbi:MAG: ABC transporter ATP-binding protein [Bacteroidota bacterium]